MGRDAKCGVLSIAELKAAVTVGGQSRGSLL